MENQGFYTKFESLPIEAQKQVLAFIDFLKKRYEPKSKKDREKKSITNSRYAMCHSERNGVK